MDKTRLRTLICNKILEYYKLLSTTVDGGYPYATDLFDNAIDFAEMDLLLPLYLERPEKNAEAHAIIEELKSQKIHSDNIFLWRRDIGKK